MYAYTESPRLGDARRDTTTIEIHNVPEVHEGHQHNSFLGTRRCLQPILAGQPPSSQDTLYPDCLGGCTATVTRAVPGGPGR